MTDDDKHVCRWCWGWSNTLLPQVSGIIIWSTDLNINSGAQVNTLSEPSLSIPQHAGLNLDIKTQHLQNFVQA